jgi:hypothetical protein
MSVPLKPIDLINTALSSAFASVQWLIPTIIYTPENYTVIYGRDMTQLNYSSDVIVGASSITATNDLYSVTLTGLEPNTTYYYQVIATNSIGANSSDVAALVTPLPGN